MEMWDESKKEHQAMPVQLSELMLKAFALYKEGKSLRAIATQLGKSKSTIDRWIKDCSVSLQEKGQAMGQTISNNGTVGQTGSDEDGTVIEKKSLNKGNEPILVTNKKGQQFMVHHSELYQQMGIPLEDLEPEPHEIIGQVKIKSVYKPWEKDGVEKMNKELKKWITYLLRLSKRESVSISELTALIDSIEESQKSWQYQRLPKNYEYAAFIESLKVRIAKGIMNAKIEKLKHFHLELKEFKNELKEILFELMSSNQT
jgi:IS30 family transposase